MPAIIWIFYHLGEFCMKRLYLNSEAQSRRCQLEKRRPAGMKTSGMWQMLAVKSLWRGFYSSAAVLLLFHLLYCVPAHRRGESDCIDHAWMQFWWKLALIIAFHYVLSPLWHLAFHCWETEKFWFSEVLWLRLLFFPNIFARLSHVLKTKVGTALM